MIRKQYSWKPVVKSFFDIAQKAGFEATDVDDGEGWEDITKRAKTQADRKAIAVDMVCAVDECRVEFLHMPTSGRVAALFVLGNGPEEICADYTISDNKITDRAFDEINDEFYAKWEMRNTPTVEIRSLLDF